MKFFSLTILKKNTCQQLLLNQYGHYLGLPKILFKNKRNLSLKAMPTSSQIQKLIVSCSPGIFVEMIRYLTPAKTIPTSTLHTDMWLRQNITWVLSFLGNHSSFHVHQYVLIHKTYWFLFPSSYNPFKLGDWSVQ